MFGIRLTKTGHETTSGGIAFLLYHLVKYPIVWQNVQNEVNAIVGSSRITSKHLSKLRYITACVRESLRLWPTIPVIAFKPRDTHNPTTIGKGKYTLKPGQTVIALLPAIHRDPDVWGNDADEFRPERMLDEKLSALPKNAWKVRTYISLSTLVQYLGTHVYNPIRPSGMALVAASVAHSL